MAILDRIRQTRFVPVVFYTALPQHVADLSSAFVKVVEKTQGYRQVRQEIAAIIKTKLPTLSRYLEEQQRKYFWDFVATQLPKDVTDGSVDLTHLMARRLAASLRAEFSKAAVQELGDGQPAPGKIHPMEYYILPPVQEFWTAGDLVRRKNSAEYFVVLTPTCDFANQDGKKVEFIVLGKCVPLSECDEYKKWAGDPRNFQGPDNDVRQLMRDNRSGQRERFTFLPGSASFPDLVVDFQQLVTIPRAEKDSFERCASLDSPFGEKLLAAFSRYFGRIGAPNLDPELALTRARSRPV